MKLVISAADPLFARTLALELKRQGFDRVAADITLFFADLDNPDPTIGRPTGAITIAFSAAPERVDPSVRARLAALCSLPFSVKELDAVLQRILPRLPNAFLICDERTICLHGKQITFSKTEAELFALLYQNRDRAVYEEEIATVLGESATISNTPAVYLYRLRRKLAVDGRIRIQTVRPKGAQWVGETALVL